jgi:hypothetical protein
MGDYTTLLAAGISPRAALDLLSVSAGCRTRALIQVPLAHESLISRCVSMLGLRVDATRRLQGTKDDLTGDVLLSPIMNPASAGDSQWAEFWIAAASAERADASDLFTDPGRFLGYPTCCTEAYASAAGIAPLYRKYLTQAVCGWPEINRLAAFFISILPIPDYFPCSLECLAARDHIRPLLTFARRIMPAEAFAASWRTMKAPMVLYGDELLLCTQVDQDGRILRARTENAVKIRLASSLISGAPDRDSPRLLSFVQWKEVDGIQFTGIHGTTALIPMRVH